MSGPFNRIIEAVASIATKLGATVTNSGNRLADNLEGIADAVEPGGGGAFVATYMWDEEASAQAGEDVYVCDKSLEEIVNALNAKRPVYAVYVEDDSSYEILTPQYYSVSSGYCSVYYLSLDITTNSAAPDHKVSMSWERLAHSIEDEEEHITYDTDSIVVADDLNIP